MIKITSPAKKLYCEKCNEIVDYYVIQKKETHNIRGDNIEIEAKVAICNVCGSELFDAYLENENLKKLFRIYAQRHDLILPEDIKRIREKYGVSQDLFSRILGIGKATIERYENGSLPTKSISNLIKTAEDPKEFLKFLEENKSKIAIEEYEKIKSKIKEILKNPDKLNEYERIFKELNESSNIYFPKLYAVVAALLSQLLKRFGFTYVTKIRFVKFLWLIDRTFYERYRKSLTKLVYAHLPMGPAPNNHDFLLKLLEVAGVIEIKAELYKDDSEIIKIYLKNDSNINILTEEELNIIKNVVEKYGNLSTEELIELTHKDEHWKNTQDGDLIFVN